MVARHQFAQKLAYNSFAGAKAIDVRAIEIEQPMVQRGLEDWPGFIDGECPIALMSPSRLAEIHRAQTQS